MSIVDTLLPSTPSEHTVVVLGASPKPDRYANMAQRLLMEHGYRTIPVHPKIPEIEGVTVIPQLRLVPSPVHTLTVYVGPDRSAEMAAEILALSPKRVIFNPGTESAELERALTEQGAECVRGCTLVMLKTKQF